MSRVQDGDSKVSQYLWRSLLYTPGHLIKFAQKAAGGEADVVILDLEDAVPDDCKETARGQLVESAGILRAVGKEVAVRINSREEHRDVDLLAAIGCAADIIIVPKVEDAEQIRDIAHRLDSLGVADGERPALIALIETPTGLLNVRSIAGAHPRLKAVNLGTEDFSLEMGIEPEWDGLLFPSQQVAVAAKAAGILALGYVGSIARFQNIGEFSDMVCKSAKLGFEGGFAIHPSQVAALNAAFSPCEADITRAERIVAGFAAAKQSGAGAVLIDGRMVDLPVVLRAERLLERARRIQGC